METATADLVHLYYQGAALAGGAGDAETRQRLSDLIAAEGSQEDRRTALIAFAEEVAPPTPPADAGQSQLDRAHHRFRLSQTARAVAGHLRSDAAAREKVPAAPRRTFTSRYFDRSAAVQRGLRPAIAFVLICAIWFATGWTNGGIFALITGALSLLIPTILPRAMLVPGGKKIGLGFLCGGLLALGATAAMPVVEGMWGFLSLFMPLIFTIFYVARGPDVPVALGATIMFAVAFSPSNAQSYDPLRAVNILATLAMMPVAFIITQTVLFPENEAFLRRHLHRAASRLAVPGARSRDSIAAQGIDVTADYGSDLDMDRPGDAALARRVRAATWAGTEMAILRDHAARHGGPAAAELPAIVGGLRRALRGKAGAWPDRLDALRRDLARTHDGADAQRAIFALIGLRTLATRELSNGEGR